MRAIVGILLVLAVAAGVAGVTTYSYNLGVAQGLAQSGKVPPPGPGVGPYPAYPYPGYPYGYPFHGPFGFGFGFFGVLWTVLLVFLVLSLLRGLIWRGYGWGGHRGHWGRGAPPWFEEWHRRAHESPGTAGTA
jgi:uncharacterized membrane protein